MFPYEYSKAPQMCTHRGSAPRHRLPPSRPLGTRCPSPRPAPRPMRRNMPRSDDGRTPAAPRAETLTLAL